jgi:hypothetical protein
MDNRKSILLALGGAYSAGDGGCILDGFVRELTNYLPRPNRYPARPLFVYDSIKVQRLVGVNTSGAMFVKSATAGSSYRCASFVGGAGPR